MDELRKGDRINITIEDARVADTYESRKCPPDRPPEPTGTVLVAVIDGSPSNERSMAINLTAPEVTVRLADDPPPAEVPITLPWSVGVNAVCDALETYTGWRHISNDVARCAQLAGISPATADRFERTLREVEAPVEATAQNDAAPGQARPKAADQPAPTQ